MEVKMREKYPINTSNELLKIIKALLENKEGLRNQDLAKAVKPL